MPAVGRWDLIRRFIFKKNPVKIEYFKWNTKTVFAVKYVSILRLLNFCVFTFYLEINTFSAQLFTSFLLTAKYMS
jgi:hypothetical protein